MIDMFLAPPSWGEGLGRGGFQGGWGEADFKGVKRGGKQGNEDMKIKIGVESKK